jgi:biopolymer transport protein ExbB
MRRAARLLMAAAACAGMLDVRWCEAGALAAPTRAEPAGHLAIAYVEPATLVAGKEAWILVCGQGFSEDAAKVEVWINDSVKAVEVRVPAPERLKARLPADTQPGSASVTVRNPDGGSATLARAVYFRAADGGWSLGATMARLRHDWRVCVEWFRLGGPVMYPLALISFFGVAWMIHCLLVLRPSQVLPPKFTDALNTHLSQGDLKGAAGVCERSGAVFARVVVSGLRKVGEAPEKVREAIAAAGSREVAHLHQKIAYLANIGTISPMLGLLGTVTGMVMGFNVIASGEVRHYLLAAAIAQALITTVVGLCIGIPAMLVYYYLRARLLRLTTHMELAADEVATTIIEKGEEA